jgi:hypothetical protein
MCVYVSCHGSHDDDVNTREQEFKKLQQENDNFVMNPGCFVYVQNFIDNVRERPAAPNMIAPQ